jgi:Septum formation
MSTEATGDGQPDAVGAVKSGAEASAPEASATAVAEPAAAERTAWATGELTAWEVTESGPAGTRADDAPPPDAEPEAGRAVESAEASGPGDGGEPGEGDDPRESDGPGEGDRSGEGDERTEGDEPPGDYEEYADAEVPLEDEALESDESNDSDGDYEKYEDYGEYEEYEDGETVEPQRARRWPRVLLALGFVVLAVVIVGGAIAIVGSLTHGFKKPVKVTYKTSAVFSLKTGDCFDPVGQQSYTLVSCDTPHEAEVFATFAVTGTKWPGSTAVQARASEGCASRLTEYVNPQLAISLTSTYVYPDSIAWQAGTRTVICEVRATSGELTGSVQGASASAD